jgi:hypothetical protein
MSPTKKINETEICSNWIMYCGNFCKLSALVWGRSALLRQIVAIESQRIDFAFDLRAAPVWGLLSVE